MMGIATPSDTRRHSLIEQVSKEHLLYTLVALTAFIPAIWIYYQRFCSPLRKIPGPFWASVTPLWRIVKVLPGDWHEKIIKLHAQYGDIVRISPNEIAINDPAAVQTIYGHTGNAWHKSEWYETWWVPQRPHSFFAETDPLRHRDLRRRISKAYSMSYILAMEKFVDPVIAKLIEQMRLREGSAVDFAQWSQYLAFDMVGELAFGERFGYLDQGKDFNGLIGIVYTFMTTTAALGFSWGKAEASAYRLVQFIVNNSWLKLVGKRIDCNPRLPFEQLVLDKVSLKPGKDRNDLLTHFQNTHNADGTPMSQADVFGESINVIGAGADTTAISFRAIVRYVCSNPRVYNKFQKEIDDAYASGVLSEIPQYSESQNLPYLQAVIKESLRLFPAVGYQLPRIIPHGGAEIGGHFIPAKTVVGINGWSLNRHQSVYGGDADCFRPERWLTGDVKAMETCYASFGYGSRTCIGKNMALMEINKVIPALFRKFDIEIVNPDNPWRVITEWFAYQTDFKVRMTSRVHGG